MMTLASAHPPEPGGNERSKQVLLPDRINSGGLKWRNRPERIDSQSVSISFRGGFLAGLAVALCIGVYLVWLWQPARQIRRHTDNFFHAIEHKDWAAAANFIGSEYQDQWGDDRARVLERMQEGFRYVRGPRIIASNPSVRVEKRRAVWTSKIMVYSTDDGVMELLDKRVNSLPAPFELEWHRFSGKPWDWKLVRASNSAFEIPADVY